MKPISIKTQNLTLTGAKGVAPRAPAKVDAKQSNKVAPPTATSPTSTSPTIQSENGVRTIVDEDGAVVKNTDSGMSSIKSEGFQSISLGSSGETFKIIDGKIEATGGAQSPTTVSYTHLTLPTTPYV